MRNRKRNGYATLYVEIPKKDKGFVRRWAREGGTSMAAAIEAIIEFARRRIEAPKP